MRNILLIILFVTSFSVKGQNLRKLLIDKGISETDVNPIVNRIKFEIQDLTCRFTEIASKQTSKKRNLIDSTVLLFLSEKSTVQEAKGYYTDKIATYIIRNYLIRLSNKAIERGKNIDIQIAYNKGNEITAVERIEDPARFLGKYYSEAYQLNIAKWQVYAVVYCYNRKDVSKKKITIEYPDFDELLKLKSGNVLYKDLTKKIFSLIVYKDEKDNWQCKFEGVIANQAIRDSEFSQFIFTENSFTTINREITDYYQQRSIRKRMEGKLFHAEYEVEKILEDIIGKNQTRILLPKILKTVRELK